MILVEQTPVRDRGDTQSPSHLNRSLQLDLLARSPEGEDTQERAKRRASISLELRNTPKGRLVYDREWRGEQTANTWQSVLEEVSEELHNMKVENVFESAQKCNENRFVDRYFFITINIHNCQVMCYMVYIFCRLMKAQLTAKKVKIADEVEVIKSPLATQSPSPKQKLVEEQRATSPPTSPVDEQLLVIEQSRKREVAAANAQRYERMRMQQQRLAAQAESRIADERVAREARERTEEEERARMVEAQMRESEERWNREQDASIAIAAEERLNKIALDKWAKAETAAREAGISQADVSAVATAFDTLESATTFLEDMVQNAKLQEEERAKAAARLEKEREAKEQQARAEAAAAAQRAREEAASQRAREEAAAQKARQEAERKLVRPPVVHQQPSQPQSLQREAPLNEASERNRLLYQEHLGLKRQFTELFASLEEDRAMKQFRFDCKKAINTPVNAITARSSADVRDKYEKLRLLLSGGEVEVVGDRRLCAATGHPQGLAYVRYLAAKQFVLQGGEVLSSKMESGFGVAAVVVGLWAEFPDFGSAFMANLYEACPYLVPLNVSKGESMSDHEYRELLGFKVKDEGLESREEYLRRIGGLAALYAAVCITTVTEEQLGAGKAHPHGLGHIWRWLSSILNLPPVTDVTATLVYQILRITGHDLLAAYGPPFTKMLVVLFQQQLPLIKEVTLESGQGAVSRLEEFLQKTIETGRIAKPPKALNAGFV